MLVPNIFLDTILFVSPTVETNLSVLTVLPFDIITLFKLLLPDTHTDKPKYIAELSLLL